MKSHFAEALGEQGVPQHVRDAFSHRMRVAYSMWVAARDAEPARLSGADVLIARADQDVQAVLDELTSRFLSGDPSPARANG